MNQKIKISQLPAKGSNLAAQDLLEIAEFTGTGYISKSITGQEIIDAAVGNVDWGDIGGTLSNQTDLQNALDAKVPTSRTLTINGVTQDLSADRTFTISTGITIGSTAIASGVVGRVLFEGAGNVVQESSSLFWDNTNSRLGIGTETPANKLDIKGTGDVVLIDSNAVASRVTLKLNTTSASYTQIIGNGTEFNLATLGSTHITFGTNSAERARFAATTGNFLINTTTDAGFRLDVNGTARVQGQLTTTGRVAINGTTLIANAAMQVNGTNQFVNYNTSFSNGSFYTYQAFGAWDAIGSDAATGAILAFGGYRASQWTGITFHSSGSERLRIFSTGNVGINTTTDAGFRLDVNGTGRFTGNVTLDQLISNQVRSSFYNTATNSFTVFRAYTATGNAAFYQNVSVGTTSEPVASAVLQADSTTKGFLPPRMTTTQKNAIATPAAGLMVYDTTLNVISYYNGSMWI